MNNPILLTDSYNLSHYFLKNNMDKEISLIYNRNRSMILNGFSDIVRTITDFKFTHETIDEAIRFCEGLPFPEKIWRNIVDKCGGKLPLKIYALPDGYYVPKNTPFAKIKNIRNGYGEFVTWYEGLMLHSSFDSGLSTRVFELREYLLKNNLSPDRVHSFGWRGHNSMNNAIKTGKIWRLLFNGTDDLHIAQYTDNKGVSIPATAHKTIQQFNDEYEAYEYSIINTKKNGFNVLSLVIDTYDPYHFIDKYALPLAILAKREGVKLIFRPDSADTIHQCIDIYDIMNKNNLLDHTGCIIGENITVNKIKEYDEYLKKYIDLNWVSFGIGAGLYKDIDRDFVGYAMKTSYSNGGNRMKFSADPIKESLCGNVNLYIKDDMLRAGYNTDNTAFDILYDFNYASHQKSKVYSWNEIKDRVTSQIGKTHQSEIIIDEDILKEKERLRKLYIK